MPHEQFEEPRCINNLKKVSTLSLTKDTAHEGSYRREDCREKDATKPEVNFDLGVRKGDYSRYQEGGGRKENLKKKIPAPGDYGLGYGLKNPRGESAVIYRHMAGNERIMAHNG